ncbi:uncharacterized protein LOC143230214 [Tachypleus tridentatus]|uniref:uncharacterized protein LOC143230214 n=1 Tax=Tachypleus tridentatus TaxID=6853 RepID=UPI003FD25E49
MADDFDDIVGVTPTLSSLSELPNVFSVGHLNLIYVNIRSLTQNFHQFLVLLQSSVVKFHIIAFSETWFVEDGFVSFSIPGYSFYSSSSGLSKASGVAVFVKFEILTMIKEIGPVL